jgi:hypothetical protein
MKVLNVEKWKREIIYNIVSKFAFVTWNRYRKIEELGLEKRKKYGNN